MFVYLSIGNEENDLTMTFPYFYYTPRNELRRV